MRHSAGTNCWLSAKACRSPGRARRAGCLSPSTAGRWAGRGAETTCCSRGCQATPALAADQPAIPGAGPVIRLFRPDRTGAVVVGHGRGGPSKPTGPGLIAWQVLLNPGESFDRAVNLLKVV